MKVRRSVGYLEGMYDSVNWGAVFFVLFCVFLPAIIFMGIAYGKQQNETKKIFLSQCKTTEYVVRSSKDGLYAIEAYSVEKGYMPADRCIQANIEDICVRNQMLQGKTLYPGDRILIPITNPEYQKKRGLVECH